MRWLRLRLRRLCASKRSARSDIRRRTEIDNNCKRHLGSSRGPGRSSCAPRRCARHEDRLAWEDCRCRARVRQGRCDRTRGFSAVSHGGRSRSNDAAASASARADPLPLDFFCSWRMPLNKRLGGRRAGPARRRCRRARCGSQRAPRVRVMVIADAMAHEPSRFNQRVLGHWFGRTFAGAGAILGPQRAGDDHDVGLARDRARAQTPKSVEIVAAGVRRASSRWPQQASPQVIGTQGARRCAPVASASSWAKTKSPSLAVVGAGGAEHSCCGPRASGARLRLGHPIPSAFFHVVDESRR